ncbi:M23 family metallopeptidase [Oscillibacter valericigenes]|uniref:M23 family metallopeptidase n=1 Tax=Oscillibacter valericigenes TaxID=351091 RepID=UPI002A667479|nr:M23 family metallopeptidase [Oscillibacter valericigenes]
MENNYRKLMEDIPVPGELETRVLRAAQRVEQAGPKRLAKRGWKPVLRGAVCAACALALVLGTVHLRPVEERGEQPGNTPVMTLDYSFGLTACAADTGETVRPNANGGLAFDSGSGIASEEAGHYTGCLFQVTGEGIETVSLSVDRGGLYRSEILTGLTDGEVRKLWQAEEAGGPVCSVYGEDEDSPMNAEVMTALGSSVTEDYDPEVRYGFWVPEYYEDPDADLRQATWASIDTFDGARLTVTAAFADGGEQSKTYTLSTGRLRVEYGEDGTRTMLPQLAGDEEPFVYGVYAASETESRWLQWPVQDSRTVWKGNPYGIINGKLHSGIDIPADQGAVILAAADGTVTEVGFDRERGNYLVLDHGGGLTTLYAHCRNVDVKEGDMVKAGEMVGAVGSTGMSTGPHLHFEVRQDGEAQNPVVYFDSEIRETLRAE